MAREKRKLFVSLPCLAIVFALVFVVASVTIWASSLSVISHKWKTSTDDISLRLVDISARDLSRALQRDLSDASDIDFIVRDALYNGVVQFAPTNVTNNQAWIDLERFALEADNQFESAYIAYAYAPASWGFAGWFIHAVYGKFFSYTNATGAQIALQLGPSGALNFSESFNSLEFLNETSRQYIANPLQAASNRSWTMSHPYISYGVHVEHDGTPLVIGADLNIATMEAVLATVRDGISSDSVVLVLETQTGVLLGSADQSFSYQAPPESVLLSPLQATREVGQEVIAFSGGKLANLPFSLRQQMNGFYVSAQRFQMGDQQELDWVVVVAVPTHLYQDDTDTGIKKAWGISGGILAGVLLLLLASVALVTHCTYIQYESRYNHEQFDDDLPLSPDLEMKKASDI